MRLPDGIPAAEPRAGRRPAVQKRDYLTARVGAVVAAPSWAPRAQRLLVPLVSVDLALQYIFGILTSAYAPVTGFQASTDFGAYDAHAINGYLLGVLMIVTIAVIALTRDRANLGISIVAFLAVLVAGVAGMAFVNTQPNPALATVTMGLAFLVAFGASQALAFRVMMRPSAPPLGGSPPAPSPA